MLKHRISNGVTFAQKALFAKHLVLVEGHTRAGKFFLANMLNGFQRMEHVRDSCTMEQVSYLHSIGAMREDLAIALIQLTLDEAAYNTRIGRYLNMRYTDLSGLPQNFDYTRYIKRCMRPHGNSVVAEATKDRRYAVMILHEGMPNLPLFLKSYPDAKTIKVIRHPVDLIYSWYKRGWCDRETYDPIGFTLCVNIGRRIVPWYALNWAHDYLRMPRIDRIITVIRQFSQGAQKTYNSLSLKHKKQTLCITYERLLREPWYVIKLISAFAKVRPAKYMPVVIERLKASGPVLKHINRERKIGTIKKIASKTLFNHMMDMASEYERRSESGDWVQ